MLGSLQQCSRLHSRLTIAPTSAQISLNNGCSTSYSCSSNQLGGARAKQCQLTKREINQMEARRPLVACRAAAPWTREDIDKMLEEEELEQEQELGQEWRSYFEDDPEGLFDYADEAQDEWNELLGEVMDMPKTEWEDNGAMELLHRFPAAMANDMIGMGTWRLKDRIDPAIEFMVARLEGCWRELCHEDLNLYPRDKWKAKGLDFCDSMDPQRELNGWAYGDVPDPAKGEEGYPRLLLENRVYCSRAFRKLHIEVGWRQDGLQVLHMVLYPRYQYDMPILAMDMVIAGGEVSLAIVDACPVKPGMRLPPHYMQTMKELQDRFLTDPDNQRSIPEWGRNIFSPLCVCLRPTDGAELAGFMKYALALHRAHLVLALLVEPMQVKDRRGAKQAEEVLEGHKRFVENQLANKKTTRVLEAAFGQQWSDQYMTTMMFDFDPTDDPPVFTSPAERLYDYFDENPELGTLPQEARDLKSAMEMERAGEYLQQVFRGPRRQLDEEDEEARKRAQGTTGLEGPVAQARIEWALQQAYDADEGFRATIDELLPEAPELRQAEQLGAKLAELMRDLAGEEQWQANVKGMWTK